MGASLFRNRATGETLAAAFRAAVDQARFEYGHGGYTGTIAEKHDVVEAPVPAGVAPAAFAEMVCAALDYLEGWQDAREDWADLPAQVVDAVRRAAVAGDSKWGPAVAVQTAPGQWVIMGWASD